MTAGDFETVIAAIFAATIIMAALGAAMVLVLDVFRLMRGGKS